MIPGSLFDRPIAPPGKGVWVNGELTFPAPAPKPTPAVPVSTLSPPVPVPNPGSEKQAGGDPFVSRLRRRCHVCGAEAGVFCVRVPADVGNLLVHRGRL